MFKEYTHKLNVFVLVVLIVVTIVSSISLRAYAGYNSLLKVYFLNVGQGDSELIEAPNGNQILIDGGPDASVLQELGKVMPINDHSIDMIILTHPHADHVNGLIEVLKNYDVDQIIESHEFYDTASYAEWDRLKTKVKVTQARAGQVIDVGNGVKLRILYPYHEASQTTKLKNAHESMVVTKLMYGDEAVVFTGDMGAAVEQELINKGVDLSAKFLKVGHHGSKTSTSEAFLNALRSEYGFIEVGDHNRYNLPYPAILDRLDRHGIKYYRTDRDGTTELILDGHNFTIKLI